MKRYTRCFPFAEQDLDLIKRKMLHWGNQSNIFLFLDSNRHPHLEARYECLCAKQAVVFFEDAATQNDWWQKHQDWLFGHISYDYKNTLEQLRSEKPLRFRFPEFRFFCPETVCYIKREESALYIETFLPDVEAVYADILRQPAIAGAPMQKPFRFQKRIKEEDYLGIIQQLRAHIRAGDCYEINFCNEAFCEQAMIDPLNSFLRLNDLSRAPFSAFYRLNDQYLLCASPERYLQKNAETITAQPIKGTRRRSMDKREDTRLRNELNSSVKDRAENVMIVDLMRNDLARFCLPGSVNVTELYGIYSFAQVHQMISTIRGTTRKDIPLMAPLRHSFPMGSMTGAPKVMVMKLIEQYEQARRELFSGTVGYISPSGDFDFNVVIRSLFYNSETGYLSYQTGGAITFDSNPQDEWEETLVKAAAMERVFQV